LDGVLGSGFWAVGMRKENEMRWDEIRRRKRRDREGREEKRRAQKDV